MLLKKSYWMVVCFVFVAFGLVACGVPSSEELSVSNKKLIPNWLQRMPTSLQCSQTVTGTFSGTKRGHLYPFTAQAGDQFTFIFEATYRPFHGAVAAIYDSVSTKRVAIKRKVRGKKIQITYKAEKSITYLLAVYPIIGVPSGDYTISTSCVKRGYCVEYVVNDSSTGESLRDFRAVNVSSYAEGQQLLAQVFYFRDERISEGNCAEQVVSCDPVEAPVCGTTVVDSVNMTYSNLCSFKTKIRQEAGTTGQSKGSWNEGVCDPNGVYCGGVNAVACPQGYSCVVDPALPDGGGRCQQDSADGTVCGGPSNIMCPSGYKCLFTPGLPVFEGVCKKVYCTLGVIPFTSGEVYPAGDGCNICTCTEAGPNCTTNTCGGTCNVSSEHHRNYLSTDVAQCSTLQYSCPEFTTPFSNSCGCGCEQDPMCPQFYDCPVAESCADLLLMCPFSKPF